MKRSEINQAIDYVIEKCKEVNLLLPPFAYYGVKEWKNLKNDESELVDNMLGWDVTDFGENNLKEKGLIVFVFRNGKFKDPSSKPYCEKLLYVLDGQRLPAHFHWEKTEDIINRGGGQLELQVWNADENEDFANTPVTVLIDGKLTTVHAGGKVILNPGQSITMRPYQYHTWRGIPRTGDVRVFEVSKCNDDNVDNRFHSAMNRIPKVEEDVEPKYLMFSDYPDYVNFSKTN